MLYKSRALVTKTGISVDINQEYLARQGSGHSDGDGTKSVSHFRHSLPERPRERLQLKKKKDEKKKKKSGEEDLKTVC